MPSELSTIPDIVIGSVVSGDLVLRNVVVSTDGEYPSSDTSFEPIPIDRIPSSNNKLLPPSSQFVSDLKVPTNLPADAVAVLIDSKTNSVIKATPAESEDFIASGAYFIGAFDRATADKVVADMINNPIPSTEYLASKFFDTAVKLGVTSYVIGVEIFRAMKNSKDSWKNFVTLEDRVMNPPSDMYVAPAPSIYPRKVTITAHQLDDKIAGESMEEVSGQIDALFPNMDSRGFSIVSSNDREFTMVGTVASASALEGMLSRLKGINDRLAVKFPSGIITVTPEITEVEAPYVYNDDDSQRDPCADRRCIKLYKPCLEGYIDADPCCPNTGNCIPDPNYVNANQPAVQSPLAQEYVNLNQTIADLQASGEDIIYNKEIPFTQEELVVLLDAGDATLQTTLVKPQSVIVPTLFSTKGGLNLVQLETYPQGSFSEYFMIGTYDNKPVFAQGFNGGYVGYYWKWQPSKETARLGYPQFSGFYTLNAVLPTDYRGAGLSPMPVLETQQQQTIIPNNDVRKYEVDVNPKYQQAVDQRNSIGSQLGVPAGCQPIQPNILPPSQVPAGCVPNPPSFDPPLDPSNPPFDPTTPPDPFQDWELTPSGWRINMKQFCGGKKPCIIVARISGGKKGTYTPKPRPFPTGQDYDDRPQLDHWDANGNMIDQYGNRM